MDTPVELGSVDASADATVTTSTDTTVAVEPEQTPEPTVSQYEVLAEALQSAISAAKQANNDISRFIIDKIIANLEQAEWWLTKA